MPLFAQNQWVESPATLALTLTATGAESTSPAKNDRTLHTAALEKIRLGNREILEDLLADGLLPTATIEGWRVAAVWANWSDADPHAGNGYRFYARRGRGDAVQTVAIPSSFVSLKPLKPTVGYRYLTKSETITGGSDDFNVLSEVQVGLKGKIAELSGLHAGSGRYVRPKGSELTYYVPRASKVAAHGAYVQADDESVSGVMSGELRFGAASFARSVNPPSAGSVSASMSIGSTWSGAVFDFSAIGELFEGTLSGHTVSGSFNFNRGNLFPSTLNLSGSATLLFSPLPASPDAVTTTLSFAKNGTLTLGTGETLSLLAGDTLPLNTLTLEQLSPLAWTPAP